MNIITFLDLPSNVIIPKDNFIKIKCQINVSNAKYSWIFIDERRNIEQPVVPNQYISFDNDGIIILKHHTSTAGKYRCRAIVPDIGIVISNIIQVHLADMFSNRLSLTSTENRYKINDRAVLICPFSAIPQTEVEYKWSLKAQEGRRAIFSSKTAIFHQNKRILELEVNSHTYGTYSCTALYAKYGLEKTSSDMQILPIIENEKKQKEPLKWVVKPLEHLFLSDKELYEKHVRLINGRRTLVTKEGSARLEFICVANSDETDDVEILWFKDNIRIDRAAIQYDRFVYEIIGQGTLVLTNVTRMYNGLYTCQASLKKNSSITLNQSFNLATKPFLRFLTNPAPIVLGDKNQEILLSCSINDIDSKNKIVWRKNGELILANSFLQQKEGFLRISKLLDSDEGIFQCLADNEFSSIQATTQLKIRTKTHKFPDHRPSKVNKLHVRAVYFRTLNITWSHEIPSFETILHYEIVLIDLSNLTQNHKISIKADRLESSVLVKNLVPDSFYKIFVYSVNGSGKSYPAIINSSPRVLSMAPTAAPRLVRITDIGSGVAIVRWVPPVSEQINGELIGYRVQVISSDSLYSKSTDLSTTQELQLSGLTPDTKYSVQIQASTRGGRGPMSSPINFETKASPNLYDEAFNIMQRKDSKILKKKFFFTSGNDKLKKFDKSSESPSQVLSWTSKGLNTSISLQWSHPSAGGIPTKYIIKWGKVYPGPYQATVQYPNSTYVINNLEHKMQYMIKIIPHNEVGDGKELLFSSSTGNPDLMKIQIPLNLGITKIGKTWAIISWKDPSSDSSDNRIYQIRTFSLDKDFPFTELKNVTENKIQISGLRESTHYSFSVRTGDVIPRDGDYNKEWAWSEWSLKESFSTMGEKPTESPQNFKLVTVGIPDVRKNDVYTRVLASWTAPNKNSTTRNDEISRYTVYFTADPKADLGSWNTQILPNDQYSAEISLNGVQKIYYFRVGCQTKNFDCPLSHFLLYKTSDSHKQNYGLLRIPEKFRYSSDIPLKYLMSKPVDTLDFVTEEPVSNSKNTWWFIIGGSFAGMILLIVLVIIGFICHKKRSQNSFPGYKLGTKSSIQHIGGAGLLLSNQSPALSNGKVSPHFVSNFGQSLKTPDLFPHPEPHFVEIESDSNQDNDSLRFASVSQHHLASSSGGTNVFNPTIQNHSLIRSHPQQMVSYYSDISTHSKSTINANAILNPLINNNISIPMQIQDSNMQWVQHQNPVYPYQTHPFTQHLISTGVGMPICSSSCLQPIHLQPQMLVNPSHEVHGSTNFSNTPRVNASELASHTSSEDIRPVINSSRVSECDISQYYGGMSNSTGKSHKTNISNKSHIETLRNSDVIKSGLNSGQGDSEVTKGFSTEELSQEMANLEGLMKDLNAITQKEFEC